MEKIMLGVTHETESKHQGLGETKGEDIPMTIKSKKWTRKVISCIELITDGQ